MSVLCKVWQEQVKTFFTQLHGHQSKTLALFVLGAIKAKSIVIPQVAEELLAESDAKASSIERRLERFLSNDRIDIEKTWDTLLEQIMPYFRREPMQLVIDLQKFPILQRLDFVECFLLSQFPSQMKVKAPYSSHCFSIEVRFCICRVCSYCNVCDS